MFRYRSLFKIVLLMGFLLLFHGAAQANNTLSKIDIRILPESIVYSDTYTLGEIAELDGFDVKAIRTISKLAMGRSPLPGRSLLVSQNQLRSRLGNFNRTYELNLIMPKRPLISRASLKISALQIKKLLLKNVKAEFAKFHDVKINIKSQLKDVYVPKGSISYDVKKIGNTNRTGGYSSWMLKILQDGKERKRIWARVKVDVQKNVVVAARRIKQGDIIEQSDLKVLKKNISRKFKETENPSLKWLIGKTARRNILAGETLRKVVVDEPVVIEEGKHVILYYKSKNMELKAMARAVKPGKMGDVIPVRNIQSQKIVRAIVLGSSSVEVAL